MVIIGENPPPIHFVAASDFGRIVASSYDDRRALGKQFYVHGPEAFTLPDAMRRLISVRHPKLKVTCLKLWQARLLSKVVSRLACVTRLISFFDRIGELGNPAETNALLSAPSIQLDEWLRLPNEGALAQ